MRLRQPEFDIATPTEFNDAVDSSKVMLLLTHMRSNDE